MSLVSTCLPSTVSKLEASLHIFKEYVYFSVSHRKKKCAPCGKRTLFTRRRHAGPTRRPPFSKLARFLGVVSLHDVVFASVLTAALPGIPQRSFSDPSHVTASLKHLEHPSLPGAPGVSWRGRCVSPGKESFSTHSAFNEKNLLTPDAGWL